MQAQYHLATADDTLTLLDLKLKFNAFFDETIDKAQAIKALEGLLNNPELGRIWFIRDEDGQHIGYVVICFSYSLEYGGRDAFIDELFLVEGFRHQGIGTATLKFVEQAARELGIRALHLEVEKYNLPAVQAYQKYGFKDHDRYLMTLLTV